MDEVENYKNKNSSVSYCYILGHAKVSDIPLEVKATIRKSLQKNKFYVHHIYIKNNIGTTSAGVQLTNSKTAFNSDIDSTITQDDNNVNDFVQNQDRSSQIYSDNFKEWFGDWENYPENASKIVDEDGKPLVVYHGTDADFTVFDKTKGRSGMDIQGMFFSPWELDAKAYGSIVRAFYLNIKNPAPEGLAYKVLNKYAGENYAGIKARDELERMGYDGVNNGDEEYIAFYPEQIKSADPVTYDDNGNVIPLSERFNEDNRD